MKERRIGMFTSQACCLHTEPWSTVQPNKNHITCCTEGSPPYLLSLFFHILPSPQNKRSVIMIIKGYCYNEQELLLKHWSKPEMKQKSRFGQHKTYRRKGMINKSRFCYPHFEKTIWCSDTKRRINIPIQANWRLSGMDPLWSIKPYPIVCMFCEHLKEKRSNRRSTEVD